MMQLIAMAAMGSSLLPYRALTVHCPNLEKVGGGVILRFGLCYIKIMCGLASL
jgi:hypothetical protein